MINNTLITFDKNEPVFMEISQKYSVDEINSIANNSGFEVMKYFFDSNNYFVDVIVRCNGSQ